LYKIN